MQRNPYARVVEPRQRPEFTVEPIAIGWEAVAFRVDGVRDAVLCVPRSELDDFLEQLDTGGHDDSIRAFLDTPPSGRVLENASQTSSTGMFDELASPEAIAPSERVPGGPTPFSSGGGTPVDARRHKGSRRPRLPRKTVLAIIAAVLVLTAGATVAASGGGSKPKPVAVATTTTTTRPTTTTTGRTTTTRKVPVTIADALVGSWDVTRTITASTNPIQPVGSVSKVKYTITEICTSTPCIVHLDAPGDLGAEEQSDMKLVGDHYEGPVTGTTPCGRGLAPVDGSVTLSPVKGDTDKFTGVLQVTIEPTDSCAAGRSGTLDLVGTRSTK